MSHESARTAEIVQNQARQHLTAGMFDADAAGRAGADFADFLEGLPGVFRVKVFAPDGRILWSNEPRLIGQTFPDNPFLHRALRGEVTASLGTPQRAEHVYERTRRYIAETYMPVVFGDSPRVAGVVETYTDMTTVMAALQDVKRIVWAVASVLGVFLYVALAAVVWKTSARERRAIDRLERQNTDLWLLRDFTRAVLGPLDLAEIAHRVVRSAGEGLGFSTAALYRLDGERPRLLASWPQPEASAAIRETLPDAVQAQRQLRRQDVVVLPLSFSNGVPHVFLGELDRRRHPGDAADLRALEIMLEEAAIALANVELFDEIRNAHARLAAILSGITDQIVIVDAAMRVVWTNTAAAEAIGSDPLGRACYEALGGSPDVCHTCPAFRTFASGKVEREVRTQMRPDGSCRYLHLLTAPLRDAAGRVVQVLEVARDVTELVEMEDRLKATNQALLDAQSRLVDKERLAAVGQLVVGLHHAILNPLTGVLGALQLLKGGLPAEERARAIAEAEAEIRRVEQLVRRLPGLRHADSVPYVGTLTMLDLGGSDAVQGSPPEE